MTQLFTALHPPQWYRTEAMYRSKRSSEVRKLVRHHTGIWFCIVFPFGDKAEDALFYTDWESFDGGKTTRYIWEPSWASQQKTA